MCCVCVRRIFSNENKQEKNQLPRDQYELQALLNPDIKAPGLNQIMNQLA
jgi:hypothetical protein